MDYKNFQGTIPDMLKQIFLEKQIKNPKFSMRAFARDIGVPPGRLSEIMSGKRNLTFKLAQKFAASYSLGSEDKKALYHLVKSQNTLKTQSILDRQFLSPQDFAKICHWQYYTVICLAQCSPEGVSVAYLADRLDVDESKVLDILATLEKVKLVQRHEDKYLAQKVSTTTTQDVLNQSIQDFQRDILTHHANQMKKIHVEYRDIQTLILPVAKNKIAPAKVMIRKFMNEFEKKISSSSCTDIYGLSLQLSPLTKVNA